MKTQIDDEEILKGHTQKKLYECFVVVGAIQNDI